MAYVLLAYFISFTILTILLIISLNQYLKAIKCTKK